MGKVPPQLYGLPASYIARICGVDLSTARRWKRGARCPPQTALWILARDLGCFHPKWSGWHINDRGELCSPENWIATPADVLSIQLTQAQLSAYRSENRNLRAAIKEMEASDFEEQPSPDQWEIAVS